MPNPSAAQAKEDADAIPAHAVEVVEATKPLRESKEWLMNSNHPLNKELEKLIPPRRSRRLLMMPEKKWKEWPTNKKKMLPTKRFQMLEIKPLRKPTKLPLEVPEVLLVMPSKKLRMLPRH